MERAAELWSQVIQVALNVIKITCQPEASTRGISDINVMATSKLKFSRWKQEGNLLKCKRRRILNLQRLAAWCCTQKGKPVCHTVGSTTPGYHIWFYGDSAKASSTKDFQLKVWKSHDDNVCKILHGFCLLLNLKHFWRWFSGFIHNVVILSGSEWSISLVKLFRKWN